MFDGGKVTEWKQGEYTFSIRQMNPFRAMKVLGDLQKLIIPAIGGAAASLQDSAENQEMYATIAGALRQLATDMDGDSLEKACTLLLEPEYIAVKEPGSKSFIRSDIDGLAAIYTGRPWDMLALCVKVFEVNFLDFSRSSSVPIGVQKALSEIKAMFQDVAGNISEE